MISKSLTFWTLIAGLLAFVAKFYFSTFPFDGGTILAAILFVLGLIGVVPAVRMRTAFVSPSGGGIVNSLAFWQLVSGFLFFVVRFFAPAFPFDQSIILAFFLFILGWFNITPELRVRGLLK